MNKKYLNDRFKLTALYTSIILVIVLIFSGIVIHTQNQQFRRFEDTFILERPGLRIRPNRPLEYYIQERIIIEEIISQIKRNNIRTIVSLDIAILLLSSIFSYYLAGKTL